MYMYICVCAYIHVLKFKYITCTRTSHANEKTRLMRVVHILHVHLVRLALLEKEVSCVLRFSTVVETKYTVALARIHTCMYAYIHI